MKGLDATTRLRHDETGLIGKIMVLWLLLAAALAVAAFDAGSIAVTKFHLSNIANDAATEAAVSFRKEHNVSLACQVVETAIESQDPQAKLGRNNGCKVDTETGAITVTIRKSARTILAGRLSFTEEYTQVTQAETIGPSAV